MDNIPEFNEIRKQGLRYEIFKPCSDCGNPRWVRLVKGLPRNQRCLKCQTLVAQKARQAKVIRQNNPTNPQIEDIRRGRDIGKYSAANKYIWHACELCSKEQWVLIVKGKPNHNICLDCQLKERLKKAHSTPYPTGKNHQNWKGGELKRKCLQCGEIFNSTRVRVRKGYGKYCSHSCTIIASIKNGLLEWRPTKPEQRMLDIITRHNLPFKYTGDGQRWIGRCNPDFINVNKTRQVIEIFGVHWHDILDVSKRIEAFRRHRFGCLIFWEDELTNERNVVARIKRFIKPS